MISNRPQYFRKITFALLVLLLGWSGIFLLGELVTKADAAEAESVFGPRVETPKANSANDSKQIKYITRVASRILSDNHYRRQSLDDSISGKVFDEYFDFLDPQKIYFTSSDITGFTPYRLELDDQLKKGDASFAFAVNDLYNKRLRAYREFAETEIAKGFDFTKNDSYIPDRRKLERAKNEEELHRLWYLKLKNDILFFRLLERSLADADKKDGDKAVSETATTQKLWNNKTPEEKLLTRLRDINNEVLQRDPVDVLGIYLTSLAQVYGPHSSYMPPKIDEDFEISMSLSLSGIGATLSSDDGYIRVVEVVSGGPAALDGRLKPEDRIIAVAQEQGDAVDVIDMPVSKAVKLIRGKENTNVKLTVLPGAKGRNAVPEIITIKRGKITLSDSEAKGTIREVKNASGESRKIGIIELPSFYMDFNAAINGDPNFKSATRDVAKILEDFKKQQVDGVIMDMRTNGGGSLPEAITLAGLFIKDGPVVQVRDKRSKLDVRHDEDEAIAYSGPLIILNSKMSASASEIFAGAMKDYDRALIVGDSRSYGKGTVLEVVGLDKVFSFFSQDFKTGSLKYESAVFYRINGSSVQQLGINSDIVLPSIIEALEIGEMFNPNHLPWDEVAPMKYRKFEPGVARYIDQLREKSKLRVADSADFKTFATQALELEKHRKDNLLSLNEETRYKEYLSEKTAQEEEEKMMGGNTVRDKSAAKDPILDETVQIMDDLLTLSQPPRQVTPAA